ncbi:LOW QUALITY PROTEIN: zf-BED domain-containing protein/DUF659 domain-containing protein, partial [Cephalotus follicularis]
SNDPRWEHGDPVPGTRGGTLCKCCGHVMKSGGVTHLKCNLAGNDRQKNVKACEQVPPEVKQEMRLLLKKKAEQNAKNKNKIKGIREELRSNILTDEAVNIVVADIMLDLLQRLNEVNVSKSQRSTLHQYLHIKSLQIESKNIMNIFKGGKIKEGMGRLISKIFIYDNVPPDKANSHHFKNLVWGCQVAGKGVEPPSANEIRTKYLDMEVEDVESYVNEMKDKWKRCVMDRQGRLNFMVYSRGSTIFLKYASGKIKDHIYIGLNERYCGRGKNNVIQVVTDNGSVYVKAGKLLMKKYNLYWTTCDAHCIDLMFEDIEKRDSVKSVILDGRMITNVIYNHSWLLGQMRKNCQGDIVRPGVTRFAINYIELDSLMEKRAGLKALYTSEEW